LAITSPSIGLPLVTAASGASTVPPNSAPKFRVEAL
jgi:hypothetical protein